MVAVRLGVGVAAAEFVEVFVKEAVALGVCVSVWDRVESSVGTWVSVPVAVFEKEMVGVAVRPEVPVCVTVPVCVPELDLVGAADGV
jgi:hypothetical protein